MLSEPFAIGNSPIHRLDPRIRVVVAVIYALVVAVCTTFPPLILAFSVAAGMICFAHLPAKTLLRRILLVNGFIGLFWVMLPLTYGGTPLFRIGVVTISRPGVLFAALLTLKSNAILLSLIALIATMPFVTLGQAMSRLYLPDKLVNLFLLTYRYIFVIEQEYKRIMRAVKIRGFVPRTSFHTYKTYAYVVGMLFVRASERADRVFAAMRCRGFKGRFYSLAGFRLTRASWLFAGLMTFIVLAIGILEWGPYG
ncbi:MAG: cobalt ECF transporter T component CbiQ [Thermodesulfobacteriota bacterium]|nr:cobalt ECF transporter T component CbiQ [Thermodesulfobacteriota bacterium]